MVLLCSAALASISAIPIDSASNSNSPPETSGLVETSLSNFFTSLSPAQGPLLPIFPPTDQFTDANQNRTAVDTVQVSITANSPNSTVRVIDADNIVRSEFINGIHKITSDRQTFEFKVLQTGDEAILTENAIVYGLPASEGGNFLIAFPVEPNPSLVTASVLASPDAFVSFDEQSISQILSDPGESSELESEFSLPHSLSPSLFHGELPSASTLFALPATTPITPFASTN